MRKQSIYLVGLVMLFVGITSALHFAAHIQDLLQAHVSRYGYLFAKGQMGHCLYLDIMMFLYIASSLFKSLYFIIGSILILCLIEFGRELSLLASFIALVTEVSFRLGHLDTPEPSVVTPFSMVPFFLLLIGISVPLAFIYFLTRKVVRETLKGKAH